MIDIGVNFFADALRGHEKSLLRNAARVGVHTIIATGTHLSCSRYAQRMANEHAMLVFTAGIHPCSAHRFAQHHASHFSELWSDPKMVAIGECGLDFFRYPEQHDQQQRTFAWHLDAALSLNKPVFLHDRDAFSTMYPMLKEFVASGGRGVIHCFTGKASEAEAYLDLGLDIGVTGWLSDTRRNQSLVESMRVIPLERLHIETDAPYLRPRNAPKSSMNVPANLLYVLHSVAEYYPNQSLDAVHAQLDQNSTRLFQLTRLHPRLNDELLSPA